MATKKKTSKKKTAKTVTKSKMELAVQVMEKMMPGYWDGDTSRKEIVEEMMKKAKLSKAGAQTYFQNIKNKMLEDEMN